MAVRRAKYTKPALLLLVYRRFAFGWRWPNRCAMRCRRRRCQPVSCCLRWLAQRSPDGNGEICLRTLQRTFGHHDSHLSRNGTLAGQFFGVHAQLLTFASLAYVHPRFLEPRAGSSNVGQGAGQEAAGAGFSQREGVVSLFEPANQPCRCGLDCLIHWSMVAISCFERSVGGYFEKEALPPRIGSVV